LDQGRRRLPQLDRLREHLNLSHPGVVEYARQCLRFWVDECHVDGFRFDLASVMGRTPAFRQDAPLFEAIRNDPRLAEVKLIAEPWDIGPGGYQGIFRRCSPSGTTISAIPRVVLAAAECLAGRLRSAFCRLQRRLSA
jgi:hypothetical protein